MMRVELFTLFYTFRKDQVIDDEVGENPYLHRNVRKIKKNQPVWVHFENIISLLFSTFKGCSYHSKCFQPWTHFGIHCVTSHFRSV